MGKVQLSVMDRAKYAVWAFSLLTTPSAFAEADSYRWMHVTINTPWSIFIFLLPMVLFPIVLMAVLYWRVAANKAKAAAVKANDSELAANIATNNEKPSEV